MKIGVKSEHWVAGAEKRTRLLAQQRVHGHDVAGGAEAALPGPTSLRSSRFPGAPRAATRWHSVWQSRRTRAPVSSGESSIPEETCSSISHNIFKIHPNVQAGALGLGFGRIVVSEKVWYLIWHLIWYKVDERWSNATMRPDPLALGPGCRCRPRCVPEPGGSPSRWVAAGRARSSAQHAAGMALLKTAYSGAHLSPMPSVVVTLWPAMESSGRRHEFTDLWVTWWKRCHPRRLITTRERLQTSL
jgi:hypothetical protein